MKRASYRTAVELIALNDNPSEMDPALIESVTVGIVADLFGVESSRVVADVLRVRLAIAADELEDAHRYDA